MRLANLILPRAEARLVVGSPLAVLTMPVQRANLLIGTPLANLTLPRQVANLVCTDQLAETFTTPSLVSWAVLASDSGDAGVDLHFSAVTDGTPCRVRYMLLAAGVGNIRSGYSDPNQLEPHERSTMGITSALLRGQTYDLYWSWITGNEFLDWTLVESAAVYVPNNGEGDFPASG